MTDDNNPDIITTMTSNQENKLRGLAIASKRSINSLAKAAGIGYAAAHGFIRCNRGLTPTSCEKLAAALGYEIVVKRAKGGR